jgi:hypothetical protein
LTPLKIALFDACFGGASRLAHTLDRSLANSGRGALVVAFDAVAPDLMTSDFEAIFLRGLQSSGSAYFSRQAADESIRAALRQAGAPYQVLYGSDDEALAQVMRAIEKLDPARSTTAVQAKQKVRSMESAAPWVWLCDKCSDPQYEHHLLTALLEQRQTRHAV